MKNFLTTNKYPLLLVALILISLWPLSSFLYIPKWDNINGYLPYRYFISDYLWNGHLPLWNPFQRLGYPGYSDLQSGMWNPIVWIIMLFGKYIVNSLIVELLSCYVFAGLGMYKLAKYFFKCKKTSFILGLSYALSGFMVGSSQLMVFLIAVTWFPWCVYALANFFKTYKLKYQLLGALFMALFITGASPSYTIILAYIVIAYFIYHLLLQRKAKTNIKKILLGGTVMLIVLVVLILPYINSFLEFVPYFNRVDKLAYNGFLLDNPFTPISYISFLLPHAVIAKSDWFNITDLSLRNGYFGLLGLMAFLSTFLSTITRFKIILLVGVVLSLLLSAGDETYFFQYLYHLPGFGVFRHPSMFRAFTIFCCLLLAGNELKYVLSKGIEKRHKIAFFGIIILITISAIWAFTKTDFLEVKQLILDVNNFVEISRSALSTHLLLSSIIAFGLFILFFILKKGVKFSWFWSFVVFVFLDLTIQTQLTIPTTIVYNFTAESLSQYFEELPKDINQSENNTPLKELDETQGLKTVNGIWQNVSTYNKTISCVGVNPMRFKSFDKAKENGRLDEAKEHNILYFEKNSGTTITDIVIGYNQFSMKIDNPTNEKKQLVLNQNYHDLWSATLNGQDLKIKKHNDLTMSVEIPNKSKGEIQFVFKSPKTIYLFMVSLLGYLLILGYLFKFRKTATQ